MDSDVYYKNGQAWRSGTGTTAGTNTGNGTKSDGTTISNIKGIASYNSGGQKNVGQNLSYNSKTGAITPISSGSSGSDDDSDNSYDYASAMLAMLQAQYQAQEQARIAKLNALKASNKESADRQIGLYNNQANKNSKQIANLTKSGTNGAMLSQQLQNNLWRDNGIHSTLNTMNTANANEESASYDTQATNLGNLTNSINSLASNYLSSMDSDSQRKFISRLEDLYK